VRGIAERAIGIVVLVVALAAMACPRLSDLPVVSLGNGNLETLRVTAMVVGLEGLVVFLHAARSHAEKRHHERHHEHRHEHFHGLHGTRSFLKRHEVLFSRTSRKQSIPNAYKNPYIKPPISNLLYQT